MSKKGENIYKRKDGRWEGRYIKDRTSSGKAVYGYVYARTYHEVKSKQKKVILDISQSTKLPAMERYISFQAASLEWLDRQHTQVKESTYNKYKNLTCSYLLPLLGTVPIQQLTDAQIDQFSRCLLLTGGQKGTGLSAKTVSDTLSVVRRILAYSSEAGYNPAASATKITVKRQEKELRVLSSKEQCLLCDYLTNHLNERNIGILLCLFTGMRIGELCALTWEDISICDQTIHVHHTMQRIQTNENSGAKTKIVISTPKSKCSIRTIPLPDKITLILSLYKKKGYFLTGSEKYFIEPLTMQNHFKRVLQASGIAPANFHALRHSFATRCVEMGFDIKSLSEILGHASVNITMNRYVHPSMELKRQNMQRLSQLIAVK